MTRKPLPLHALRFAFPVAINGEGEGKRRFEGVAYSGDEIVGHAFWEKVIFDLSSTRANPILSALFNHDTDIIVGRTDRVDIGSDVKVSGELYNDADGQRITGKPGHPWEMSVYIRPGRIEEVLAGQSAEVNGRKFTGPGHIFRDSVIREVSFCALGADPNTRAAVFGANDSVNIDYIEGAKLMPNPNENTPTVEQLQAQVAALTAENTALKEKAKAARTSAVKALFADLGREFKDEAAKPYIEMDDAAFDAISADLRASKKAAPSHLFNEEATGSGQAPGQGGKSILVADAERRAKSAK
jgi:hypothetical protein